MAEKKLLDLTNQKFSMLTVLRCTRRSVGAGNHTYWMCVCDCGVELEVRQNSLRTGNSKSCGCVRVAKAKLTNRTHGLSSSKIRTVWSNMKSRCYSPNSSDYENYGARGITVCAGWKDDLGAFARDMGEKPAGMTLERKDVNLGYHCGKCAECIENNWELNCVWDTRAAQNRNKRNSFKVTYNGETKTLAEWCHQLGKKHGTVWMRMTHQGMSFEEAIAAPVMNTNQHTAAKYLFRGEQVLLSKICKELDKTTGYFHVMAGRGHSIQDLIDKLAQKVQ